MKPTIQKSLKSVCLFITFFSLSSVFSQAPQKMSYQAVIRNAGNTLVSNTNVGVKVSILQTSATGIVVYSERHTPTTNTNGLATFEIGGGTVLAGDFATINWANGPYFIKTETDPAGGTNYTISGTNQLLSVPFALYAASGNPGPQGPIGLTGPAGPQGPIGLTGATGPQGPIGLTGATGPQGPIGLTGPAGTQGAQGPIGLTGATGSQGPIGLTGPAGPAGPQGAQGPIGLTGPQGEQGPQGVPGSTSGSWTVTGNDIANNNIGNVGIGTGATVPSSLLTVKKDGIGFTQEDGSGATKVGFYTSSSGAWVQTHSNNDLLFTTNDGSTQMTLQKATGNLGIGVINPLEKLEVAGKTKTTDIQMTNGAGAGKVLTSDALGNASWNTLNTGVVNQYYEKTSGGLSTTTQGAQVDFPETNLTIPVAGTYLINYYVDATNNFYLNCYNNCTTPRPFLTRSHLYNKSTNEDYQIMRLDNSIADNSDPEGTTLLSIITLPSHPVSASVIKTLSAGDNIGIKLESLVTGSGVTASITLSICSITAVRLF